MTSTYYKVSFTPPLKGSYTILFTNPSLGSKDLNLNAIAGAVSLENSYFSESTISITAGSNQTANVNLFDSLGNSIAADANAIIYARNILTEEMTLLSPSTTLGQYTGAFTKAGTYALSGYYTMSGLSYYIDC